MPEQPPGDGEDEETIREPTKTEIEASFKPENVIAVQTVRDKKRGVHNKILEKKKESNESKDLESIKAYLSKWKDDRETWQVPIYFSPAYSSIFNVNMELLTDYFFRKFEKRKQVYIQNHCFESSKIQDEDWSVCLEYLEGSQGKGRESLVARAEKLISELDSVEEKDEVAMAKYNRSRDLLQMLN